MTIELIHPVAMEQGLTFAIREGGRTVGSGRVATIIEQLNTLRVSIDLIGSALCLQGVEPFYVRRLKPTHGLKLFLWTCGGLVLSFGLTTLNLVPCGLGSSDASAGAVTSDVAISF